MGRSKQVVVKTIPQYTGKGRLIAIGDVHGCVDELIVLIKKLELRPEDTVIPLGDFVDRGPDPEGVVQYCIALQTMCHIQGVMGNHDSKVVRYHNHCLKQQNDPSYKIPMLQPPSYHLLSETSLAWLAALPHAVFVEDQDGQGTCFVHAGIGPWGFNQDPNAFIRNRYLTRNVADGKLTPVKSIEIDGVWYVPEGSQPWYRFWDGRWVVIYGHSINVAPVVEGTTIGIDTGCCFGGFLTAWVREGRSSRFVSVRSKVNFDQGVPE